MRHSILKKGYLNHQLEIFYILDRDLPVFQFHYHDFYKLLIHLSGDVTYQVEGQTYHLAPGDTLLICPGEIHRPSMTCGSVYERIIDYISEDFFSKTNAMGIHLKQCYELAEESHSHVVRFSSEDSQLSAIASSIKDTFLSPGFGDAMLRDLKIREYMIFLIRRMLFEKESFIAPHCASEKTLAVMAYIHQHFNRDLSIAQLSTALSISPSYLMHSFKKETGYTVGHYITEKRLFAANQYIQSHKTMTEACYLAGFQNYSTFFCAYKKKYGRSPKNNATK